MELAKLLEPGISQGLQLCPSDFPAGVQAALRAEEILYSANADHSQIRNVKFGHASGINCSGLVSLSGNVGIILPHGGFEKVSYLMLTRHAKENWREKKK